MHYCPHCQEKLPVKNLPASCPRCGRDLAGWDPEAVAGESVCSQCRVVFSRGEVYCPHDGRALLPVDQVKAYCSRCQTEYGYQTEYCPLDGAPVYIRGPHEITADRSEPGSADDAIRGTAAVVGVLRHTYSAFYKDIRLYFRYGLRIFFISLGLAVAAGVSTLLLGDAGLLIGAVAVVYYSARFSVALTMFCLLQAEKKPMKYEDFFRPRSSRSMRTAAAYLVVMSAAGSAAYFTVPLWIANFMLTVGTFFLLPLAVEQELPLLPALQESLRRALVNGGEVLVLTGLAALINVLGLLFFGVGIAISLPFSFCLYVQAYRYFDRRR